MRPPNGTPPLTVRSQRAPLLNNSSTIDAKVLEKRPWGRERHAAAGAMDLVDDIARQLRRALVLAGLVAVGEAALALALPLLALAAIEGVLPAGDVELLRHLLAAALVVAVAAALLRLARQSLLLRTSLWVEHGFHASTQATGAPTSGDADRLGAFVGGRSLAALLDVPGLLVPIAAALAVSPRLGLAGGLLVVSTLACAAAAILASHRALGDAMSGADRPGANLEARYRAASRIATADAVGRALALGGIAAIAALAMGLAVRGTLSTGAAVAVVLALGHATLVAQRTIAAAPDLVVAALAWRNLAEDAAASRTAPPAVTPAASAAAAGHGAPADARGVQHVPAALEPPPPVRPGASAPAAAPIPLPSAVAAVAA